MRPALAPVGNQLADTIDAYLDQLSLSLRASSITSATGILGRFAQCLSETHPDVVGAADIDRYIPLHPQLVDLLAEWDREPDAHAGGLLLTNDGRPLNRHAVARMLNRITKAAGIGHVHPHQLRHTVATQAINRGMSLEAIAALLGHRSLDMTMTYARIADRTVADEYFAVTQKVEALYDTKPQLPADAEGPNMARLRREHHRMLGNGYCTRPVELDCAFETICETCTYFATTVEFRPTLRRQHKDAQRKHQTGREQLYKNLLDQVTNPTDPTIT